MQFKSAEDVYNYLARVGNAIVRERDALTTLFKRIQ
jgi:hypothetical protein